ncbi:MAG: DUF452 family protein [Phocaeicola sp.]
MIQKMSINEGHSRLLIFFAGWAADETPFKSYRPADMDYMICYDYRTLSFDFSLLKSYEEIVIVGWSMGVWAASQLLSNQRLKNLAPIKRSIAINGTPYPIDDTRGIPTAIYQGTLEGLSASSLHKFFRRMCANGETFRRFLEVTPRRELEEVCEELTAIAEQYRTFPHSTFTWTEAIVGNNDRIIPPANQLQAWEEAGTHIFQTCDAHYQEELFNHYLQEVWTKS